MFPDHDGPLPVRDGSLIAPFLTEMGPVVRVGLDLQHQLSQRGSGGHVVACRHVRHFHRHLELIVFPSAGEPQLDGLVELRYGMTPRHLVQVDLCQSRFPDLRVHHIPGNFIHVAGLASLPFLCVAAVLPLGKRSQHRQAEGVAILMARRAGNGRGVQWRENRFMRRRLNILERPALDQREFDLDPRIRPADGNIANRVTVVARNPLPAHFPAQLPIARQYRDGGMALQASAGCAVAEFRLRHLEHVLEQWTLHGSGMRRTFPRLEDRAVAASTEFGAAGRFEVGCRQNSGKTQPAGCEAQMHPIPPSRLEHPHKTLGSHPQKPRQEAP